MLPHRRLMLFLLGVIATAGGFLYGEEKKSKPDPSAPAAKPSGYQPDLADLMAPHSEMQTFIERFQADRGSLEHSFTIAAFPRRQARTRQFLREWLGLLLNQDFEAMRQDGRIDYLVFKNYLEHELRDLDREDKRRQEQTLLLPFAQAIIDLEEAQCRMEHPDAAKIAGVLDSLKKQIDKTHKAVEEGLRFFPSRAAIKTTKMVANRAVATAHTLRKGLHEWFHYYEGYDPLFTWWAGEPYKAADDALGKYADFLREKVVGVKPDDDKAIIGDPIGREALLSELAYEMIPYTPEGLIAIAEKEFVWCEAEMKKASHELGYGDDWHKALEHVKNLYVEPGKQPDLIRDLARQALEFVDKHDLVTVPPLCRDGWRMNMMTPKRQLVNPFFTGGETISVSFPTSGMSHEQKLMSMRGNNIHFAHATVLHELIPGHHLQLWMAARYHNYRELFVTPFLTEGWALYWEMLLYDMGFSKSPEDRIGMLFWRMHRCARIMFSLGFHLGKMTPQQCVDLLVNRVGHERENALGEVRRSFAGLYGPLYQAAYLLGGLQIRQLNKELVASGKMTPRAFHDAILKEGRIPIAMIRASLTGLTLARDYNANWKFYGAAPAQPVERK